MGIFDRFKNHKQEEPVQLPVSLKKVAYVIGGERAYTGDLIITQGVIYYIPRTDEINKKIQSQASLWAGVPGGMTPGTEPSSYSDHPEAEGEMKEPEIRGPGAELQEKLDAYIEELKSRRRGGRFSSSLPLPMRFARSEMKNLSVSVDVSKTGVLQFDGAYDQYLFVTKFYEFKLLREAMVEGAFIS